MDIRMLERVDVLHYHQSPSHPFRHLGQSTSTSSWWLSHFVVKSLRFTSERDVSETWYRMLYQVRVSMYIIGWGAGETR